MSGPFLSHQPVELTETEFSKIRQLVYDQCGIYLTDGKKELVKARLNRRIQNGRFKSFQEYYCSILQDHSGQELIHLLDSISTNYTFFFREEKHFDFLRSEFIPEMVSKKESKSKKIRFWSAGCSSGEEAYSIAMTILETIEHPKHWEISILATDLSTKVLKIAEEGIFPAERIRSIPSLLVKKYFLRGVHDWKDYVKVKEELKKYIQFRRLNLKESFHFKEPFDCIFCRNVMIYFDKHTQIELVRRFYDSLERGGCLLIGHSESLTGISHPFQYVRPAIYKK